MKKTLFTILCVCLLLGCVACTKTENTIMTYKGAKAPESLYSYWMSTYKSVFLDSFNDGIDSDEFWDMLISDDMTYEEYIVDWINTEMKYRTVALKLFDEYGLELTDSTIERIDADISEKLEYAESREELNTRLAKFNMNIDMLREVYIANEKYESVREYLYGQGGEEAPTDKERAEYFADNYYCLKYITIYSGVILKTDESGAYVYDEDGQIELIKLDDEQKALKKKIIDSIIAGVEAGGDFDEYMSEYSEVDYSEYPNGFFVSENDSSRLGGDIINAAKEINFGEIKVLSDENITYIVKKLDLPEYTSLTSSDKTQLEDMDDYIIREKFAARFGEYAADVVVNEELTKRYNIREISENSYF
ncbi:MAG: hypothetical protein IKT46_08850 [Clostridia bacterium]|nr:hypothetical protein [Clostridia bacterium]